jgi:glycerol-3-phosphate cytidylyltransferase
MIGIGYAPSAYDLLHIGHLNLLRRAKERRAKEHCDYLIAGIVAIRRKGVTPVVPLAERVEIARNVRFVDAAIPALTNDKVGTFDLKARTGVCHRKSGGNVSGIVETRHR